MKYLTAALALTLAPAVLVCALTGPASPQRLPTLTPTSAPTATLAPTATTGPTATPVVFEFSGIGDGLIRFTTPQGGLAEFILTHQGDGNFTVKLVTDQGEYIDLLVNEIGNYEGVRASRIEAGEYILEITATDGAWAAIITPPQ